ncbi:FMN-dependent oxidoreductase, nitrilotriacetate monooxygenase family [Novosphingobium sp. Rr 2-17]|uniref:LLM class flavin-dependent oxidoreductase n=1 Tax=Novosphingobium sp. Rr 2-17 TaxID=555793 RepID=UPI00026984D3|nr:LLM class flavin-dependent oxidoreductase [Novosphingobium sp. Rr 2-17]EIZ80522.1 FMN-dependent oxidoreductase, nitrilotriacetate monooxygenase family [Novosphingobium sp. Rr 2-17]
MTRPFILSASVAEASLAVPQYCAPVLTAAEAAGLDLLIFGRSGTRPFDAQVLLPWAAPLTTRIGLVATVPASNAHPFHVARALSAIDFLSAGRTGWSVIGEGAPQGLAEDMVLAARALWDGWDSDTLILDKSTGRYLDASKVRASNYEGPFFKVAGPLNAMRPPLGHPLLVVDGADPIAIADADIALFTEEQSSPPATKRLLKVALDADVAALTARFEAGEIDGVHFTLDVAAAQLPLIGMRFAALVENRTDIPGDLRARLGLPIPSTASNQTGGAVIPEYA